MSSAPAGHGDGAEEDGASSAAGSSAGSVGPSTSSSADDMVGARDHQFLSLINIELRELDALLALTPQEQACRQNMVQRVQHLLQCQIQGAAVNVYGSWCTGLALPSSDVDFVVLGAPQVTQEMLQQIASGLEQNGLRCTLQLPYAKVPLLKFVCPVTGLRCDVTFDVPTWQQSVEYVRNMLDEFADLHGRLLVVVLKLILVLTSMNDVSKGGLSSYGLCLMVFAFLRRARASAVSDDAAQLFIELVRHYGSQTGRLQAEFNPMEHTVDCSSQDGYRLGTMEPVSQAWKMRAAPDQVLWCVQDPLMGTNNVTEPCWQMPRISQHFAEMTERLAELRMQSGRQLKVVKKNSSDCPLLLHAVYSKTRVLGQFVESRRVMQKNWSRRTVGGFVHAQPLFLQRMSSGLQQRVAWLSQADEQTMPGDGSYALCEADLVDQGLLDGRMAHGMPTTVSHALPAMPQQPIPATQRLGGRRGNRNYYQSGW